MLKWKYNPLSWTRSVYVYKSISSSRLTRTTVDLRWKSPAAAGDAASDVYDADDGL